MSKVFESGWSVKVAIKLQDVNITLLADFLSIFMKNTIKL